MWLSCEPLNPLWWIPLSFSPFFVVKLSLGVCISGDLQQTFLKTPLVHQSQHARLDSLFKVITIIAFDEIFLFKLFNLQVILLTPYLSVLDFLKCLFYRNWFLNLIFYLDFCLFRAWFLQATQAVKIKFETDKKSS